MFPSPDKFARKALASGDVTVFKSYRVLAAYEEARLRKAVAPVANPLRRANLTALLDQAHTHASGPWINTLTVRADVAGQLADLFGRVQKALDGHVPPAADNVYLNAAIDVLENDVLVPARTSTHPNHQNVLTAFARLFGSNSSTAIARFADIVQALRAVMDRTDKTRGFLFNDSLPAGMGALASGTGKRAVIQVSRAALDGAMHRWELAATLAHEGSHILATDATVDIVYRHHNAAYYLHGTAALQNAANFEQVVLEVLGQGGPFPTDSEVGHMRGRTAPRVQSVQTVLSSRIARAWVRTFDFSQFDYTRVDVPKAVTAVLSDVPLDTTFAAVISAYMDALHATMLRMMELANGLTIVEDANEPGISHAVANGAVTVTINDAIVRNETIEQLTARVLGVLCPLVDSPVPDHKPELAKLIIEIEQYDREHLFKVLDELYRSF